MFGFTLVCRELEEKLVNVTAFLPIFYDDDDDLLQRGVQQLLCPLSVLIFQNATQMAFQQMH